MTDTAAREDWGDRTYLYFWFAPALWKPSPEVLQAVEAALR